jgi:hypothetical protein
MIATQTAVSWGTPSEMVYAYFYRKPVYMLALGKMIYHPWITYHATGILCKSVEEFKEWFRYEIAKSDDEEELISQLFDEDGVELFSEG